MDNLFNTDSGFRPPSPLTFSSAPGPGLFGDSLGFEDFRFANQDFLNMSTSPGGTGGVQTVPPPGTTMMVMANDPSMQLFNPSEQRYFSEFLDTLVVDQDFTFDPSSIPNLPNLPLFSQDVVMPGGFNIDINNPYRLPPTVLPPSSSVPGQQQSQQQLQQQQQPVPQLQSQQPDYDMGSGGHGFNDHQGSVYPQPPISVSAKRTKTSKGASVPSSSVDSPARRGTPSSSIPSSLDAHTQDPAGNRIAAPIQQLSKLSLNQSVVTSVNGGQTGIVSTKAKKNKREEDDFAQPSSSQSYSHQQSSHHYQQQQQQKESSRDRNTSMSDEDGSDSATMSNPSANTKGGPGSSASASTSTSTTSGASVTKRKPYKELLTEEEKRANHIASEQKRRNTIRNGFKDMTDIIPDLKDVNSSKSTILFKAVDFIRHLERRNKLLQEKASQLESRLLMQKGGQTLLTQQQQVQAQQQAQQHSSYRGGVAAPLPFDPHQQPQPQQHPPHLQHHHQHHQQHHNPQHSHHHQQQQHRHQPYHNAGLDDKRLQEIPNIYPISMSR
ncbi:hypothetical protein BGX29_004574 [Mortierella sp. GBA35]|nr:hypothetical protein BGX23_011199 [Mortierella sp. AD031]KAF9102456.1 hypothetical protein BGX29_004574 [Mortierella sp. GBA35]KAG0215287.1 hypothetical protein BGX33_001301 [Mortierella sp. NVP41]